MTGTKNSYYPKIPTAVLGSVLVLAGCVEGEGFNPFKPRTESAIAEVAQQSRTRTLERDVEAPEIFQKNDRGLWDGRPSLGGVWVAHADVVEPGRVIIRNETDGKFVVGALFRRERLSPGPEFQISSEAAAALGILAGQPTDLSVTALRREEIVETLEIEDIAPQEAAVSEAEVIEEIPLDPIEAAAAAIENAADTTDVAEEAAVAVPTATQPETPSISKPFIQIGIFSVEINANDTATAMHTAGMEAEVRALTSNGREFWRVVVGPAATRSDRAALLSKVKDLGFADAYFVRR